MKNKEQRYFEERWEREERENAEKSIEERVHELEKKMRWIESEHLWLWRTADRRWCMGMSIAVAIIILLMYLIIK